VLVLRDVTREREIERMKTEFLSNVSHELRTPLTPIKGYAEVLARRDVGAEATRKFASQILDSTGRLERIVATIVDFAALDSGRLELRPQPLVLHDMVEEMLEEWRAAYPGREFRRRVGKTLPPAAADPVMLRRCLDELVSNAVKFSPSGGPVSITAMQASYGRDPRPLIRISVRDRGVGIEPEVAARIFGDFYQGDASETRHYGGLGLGLALVRRIIEGMDGHVDLESQSGEGATFHLFLPLAHGEDLA
jgi:signal transduction histidine kinase